MLEVVAGSHEVKLGAFRMEGIAGIRKILVRNRRIRNRMYGGVGGRGPRGPLPPDHIRFLPGLFLLSPPGLTC